MFKSDGWPNLKGIGICFNKQALELIPVILQIFLPSIKHPLFKVGFICNVRVFVAFARWNYAKEKGKKTIRNMQHTANTWD